MRYALQVFEIGNEIKFCNALHTFITVAYSNQINLRNSSRDLPVISCPGSANVVPPWTAIKTRLPVTTVLLPSGHMGSTVHLGETARHRCVQSN